MSDKMTEERYRVNVCRWCGARELGVCQATKTEVLCCMEEGTSEVHLLARKVMILSSRLLALESAYKALRVKVDGLEPDYDDIKIGGSI